MKTLELSFLRRKNIAEIENYNSKQRQRRMTWAGRERGIGSFNQFDNNGRYFLTIVEGRDEVSKLFFCEIVLDSC